MVLPSATQPLRSRPLKSNWPLSPWAARVAGAASRASATHASRVMAAPPAASLGLVEEVVNLDPLDVGAVSLQELGVQRMIDVGFQTGEVVEENEQADLVVRDRD